MAKFVELEHHDILSGQNKGTRKINVDTIKEIVGPLSTAGNITRVKLIDGNFIDVPDTPVNVQNKIESI